MYYRVTDHVALRSWPDTGFAVYRRGTRKPFPLAKAWAAAMLLADGEHDMQTDDTVMLHMLRGLIEPCEKAVLPLIPMGKLIQPEDIANTIVFLASEQARMITGQVIKVSGGHAL